MNEKLIVHTHAKYLLLSLNNMRHSLVVLQKCVFLWFFSGVMGSSSAPEVLLFKRFQAHWPFVNQDKFEDSSTDQLTAGAVAGVREDLGVFLTSVLTEDQARDDYRELLEITLIFF